MTSRTQHRVLRRNSLIQPARKRRWWRWIAIAAAALLLLVVVAAIAFVKFQSAPAPLALPRGAAAAPSGPVNGTWTVSGGSAAGFRVRESAFGVGNDVVGRTTSVTGSVVVTGNEVTSATFRINLNTITVGGKAARQFSTSLNTRAHPLATVVLTRPVTLSSGFAAGSTVHVTATAQLALNGTTRPVTVALSARRTGSTLEAAGTIPISFSRWGVKGPAGFGFIASLASNGTAEFLLVLHRY